MYHKSQDSDEDSPTIKTSNLQQLHLLYLTNEKYVIASGRLQIILKAYWFYCVTKVGGVWQQS